MENVYKIHEVLDDARFIASDPELGYVVVWYGGPTIRLFSMFTWKKLDCMTIDDCEGRSVNSQDAALKCRNWLDELRKE